MALSAYQCRKTRICLSHLRGTLYGTMLLMLQPNNSRVLLLFGKYVGSVKKHGFYWIIPFYTKTWISLRLSNLDSERLKVNDKLGNPVMISTILVWRV